MANDYKFTKMGIMVSVSDDADLDELFRAFQGFLVSSGWDIETVISWYGEMAALKHKDDKVIANKDLMLNGPVSLRYKTEWTAGMEYESLKPI